MSALLKNIVTCSGRNSEYPKLFLFLRNTSMKNLGLLQVGTGWGAFSLIIDKYEVIGKTDRPPTAFKPLPIMALMSSSVLDGVVVMNFETEARLYQEMILELTMRGHLDQERVAKSFDQITKLVALATRNTAKHEATLARDRAVTFCKRLLSNVGGESERLST